MTSNLSKSRRHCPVPRPGAAGLLLLLATACTTAAPRPGPLRPDDPELVGQPVFQPMLVLGMPSLAVERSDRPLLAAMTARNAPVTDVLLGMFKDSDINLVVDAAAQAATCTFDLKQVTAEEAFESLLRSLDLGYEWDGSFLRVRSVVRATLNVDLLTVAAAAASSDRSGGSTADGDAGAGGFWAEIQRLLPEVMAAGGRAMVNQTAGTIHLEASPGTVERLREIVETTVRRRNAQVSLEARILEVRLDDRHNLGVDWSLLPGLFHSSKTGLGAGGGIVSQTAASGGTALTFGLLDTNDFSLLVDALQRQGQVRVLSSPRVSTMNNVPAQIRVVDQIPVISREVITDQGVARSEFSVDFVDAGVSVQVTPLIGEDGMITVSVHPEVTQQTGTVVTPDGLIEQPILSRRETTTVVRVADGQAIAVGGLRSTRKSETLQGVPFLMELPLLGQLFSSTVQTREEVELMVVLVPRVLDQTWIDEEMRRGAHRLEVLRRPFRWGSIGMQGPRDEDYRNGALQGAAASAAGPSVRTGTAVAAPGPDQGRTITRAGLAEQILGRAQTALEHNQSRQALAWLEQALGLDPRRPTALVAAGILLERQGQRERARAMLDRALAISPEDPLALTARGALELGAGAAQAARVLLQRAHAAAPGPETATNLGAALIACGEHAAARDVLRGAAGSDGPPELSANLAFAELTLGDHAAARAGLDLALQAGADPRNPRIHALQRLLDAGGR